MVHTRKHLSWGRHAGVPKKQAKIDVARSAINCPNPGFEKLGQKLACLNTHTDEQRGPHIQ